MSANKNNTADIIWDLPGSNISVMDFQTEQAISELYLTKVRIKTPDPALAFADMLYAEAKLTLKCGDYLDDARTFGGIITRFGQGRTLHGNLPNATQPMYSYEVEIRPKLWLLTRQFRSRVYQKMSAKDIIEQILGEFGIANTWNLNGSPYIRDYCVQYQETDYAFMSRLLEDEGICFYFDQQASKVVFCDNADGHTQVQPIGTAKYIEERTHHFGFGKHEFIGEFSYEQMVQTGAFSLSNKNYETSQYDLTVKATDGEKPCFTDLEYYEHTRNYRDRSEGDIYLKYIKEGAAAEARLGHGVATCRAFEAGQWFTMSDHYRKELNVNWLLLSCRIEAEQGKFKCWFTALHRDIPFRPLRRTPKPKVFGLQTALITGPPGSKVYLDQFGRCKLKFHWERKDPDDDRSSMWVRVSNNYAGKDYGIQWIPRVGHEVLVTFIEGDPDRPVVTGRVYNDFNTPPLGPAKKFQNIIKSIKDNHIMFDDKDGAELVEIRAEKNMDTLVVNDDSQDIGNDRTIVVGRHHRENIGKNMFVDVGANLTEKVVNDYDETVGEHHSLTIGKNHTTTVGDNQELTVGGDQDHIIHGHVNHEVKKTFTETITKDVSISAKKNYDLDVGEKLKVSVTNDMIIIGKKKGTLNLNKQLTIHVGNAKMILKKNGDIMVEGKKVNVKASGAVAIKGSKIGMN